MAKTKAKKAAKKTSTENPGAAADKPNKSEFYRQNKSSTDLEIEAKWKTEYPNETPYPKNYIAALRSAAKKKAADAAAGDGGSAPKGRTPKTADGGLKREDFMSALSSQHETVFRTMLAILGKERALEIMMRS